ncbi:crotonase/enoyl-CoA hydratase family protein [Pseudomonas sp. UMC631]|nr:crotonase/enoyl-CoA hydratase family protein [Pseudomonas citronellolis]NTX88519.1 crotonase/enoyl-CoA hydratase family protein [Pseudomonas sp. UMA643]NTY22043.1 crotonase/enoyl-CoA hydratase family protein [Pseudomonas sp. UMC3103]NTY28226.1 crotonase/enoyl-CoA hydratase family protein [Pseudomonas sp. UMA603]NTY30581.1 crotonase/enoyl-CoA hydratase family protein [Pseudomonas sp. UMC3129]NTY55064.1 crotonase/enoyl-CoA hydratase family protein [Pseudomonas sp. UMC631]NTY69319.1 crotonase
MHSQSVQAPKDAVPNRAVTGRRVSYRKNAVDVRLFRCRWPNGQDLHNRPPAVYTEQGHLPGARAVNPTSEPRVTVTRRGHLLLLGLNRPQKRNAFDQRMLDELMLALGDYERDDDLRCALIVAHGEHFSAGLDLADVSQRLHDGWQLPAGAVDPWGTLGGPRLSKPLVVAVQGYCYTIGIELMLAADICLCASTARFAQMEVRRGLLPLGGATLRLPQVAGWGNAMRWLLSGDEFDAHEAWRLGLVQEIHPPEELLPEALKLAARIARRAPLAVRATLASARRAQEQGTAQAIRELPQQLKALLASEDAREGLQSLLERREGNFSGN